MARGKNPLLAPAIAAASSLVSSIRRTRSTRKTRPGNGPTRIPRIGKTVRSTSSLTVQVAGVPRQLSSAPTNIAMRPAVSRLGSIVFKIPFKVTIAQLVTAVDNTVTLAPVTLRSAPASFPSPGFDVSPRYSATNAGVWGTQAVLGPIYLKLASIFSRWRLTDMSMQYQPMCNTGTNGAIAIAYNPDPYSLELPSYTNLSTHFSCINCAPWETSEKVQVRDANTSWLFTRPQGNDATANSQRLTMAGCFYATMLAQSASQFYGTLTLEGHLEMSGLDSNEGDALSTLLSSDINATVSTLESGAFGPGPVGTYQSFRFGSVGAPCTAAAPFSSSPSSTETVSGGYANLANFTANTLVFPIPGTYVVRLLWRGTATVSAAATNTAIGTATVAATANNTSSTVSYDTFQLTTVAATDGVTIAGNTGLVNGVCSLEILRTA